ncbi:MAG: hypothetical protein ACI9LO_002865 [Planctomycetota bacterium]
MTLSACGSGTNSTLIDPDSDGDGIFNSVDVDDDNDGLTEIANLEQLD